VLMVGDADRAGGGDGAFDPIGTGCAAGGCGLPAAVNAEVVVVPGGARSDAAVAA